MIRHAGLIALRLGGVWRGLLIEGPSGSGKSDLALRALEVGFRLVADDRVQLWASDGQLWGRAPDTLSGLMESRGLGVLGLTPVPFAPISLVVRCEATPDAVERFPGGETFNLAGISLPLRALWPFDPAAAVKLRLAMQHLGSHP
ncbi:MAG: HPr kinase/phosphorylase [Caulobacter sp.]|nr:HPr kinase/phosphorylase [Caulobacter sp.]